MAGHRDGLPRPAGQGGAGAGLRAPRRQGQGTIPVSGYLFYSHANKDGSEKVHTPDDIVALAQALGRQPTASDAQAEGRLFLARDRPRFAVRAARDLRHGTCACASIRRDRWTTTTAIRIGRELDAIGLEYYEDPCWGISAMATVGERSSTPIVDQHVRDQLRGVRPGDRRRRRRHRAERPLVLGRHARRRWSSTGSARRRASTSASTAAPNSASAGPR